MNATNATNTNNINTPDKPATAPAKATRKATKTTAKTKAPACTDEQEAMSEEVVNSVLTKSTLNICGYNIAVDEQGRPVGAKAALALIKTYNAMKAVVATLQRIGVKTSPQHHALNNLGALMSISKADTVHLFVTDDNDTDTEVWSGSPAKWYALQQLPNNSAILKAQKAGGWRI